MKAAIFIESVLPQSREASCPLAQQHAQALSSEAVPLTLPLWRLSGRIGRLCRAAGALYTSAEDLSLDMPQRPDFYRHT